VNRWKSHLQEANENSITSACDFLVFSPLPSLFSLFFIWWGVKYLLLCQSNASETGGTNTFQALQYALENLEDDLDAISCFFCHFSAQYTPSLLPSFPPSLLLVLSFLLASFFPLFFPQLTIYFN
jgi:hypothetical protein